MSMSENSVSGVRECIPLLIPDMPSPQLLMPWLERMHATKQYSNFGPLVRELEASFAHNFDCPAEQITTVSNATQGLELVLQALNLRRGAHVLIPAFTFVATATAVLRAGCIPVLADVDLDSWMITPSIARDAYSRIPIDAVLPVATFGMPHDMHAWQQFELETGLPVVIDAAASYGSQWLQEAHGTLVFSLHTTKSLPAGEGGLVVSSRPGLAARVRQLSNFGINLDSSREVPVGSLAYCGTNAKMSEYHAAIGLASLESWSENAHKRRCLQKQLRMDLDRVSGNVLSWQMQGLVGDIAAPTLLCARWPNHVAREKAEYRCNKAGIMTRRWYQPLLQNMPALVAQCKVLPTPNAYALEETILGLPFFTGMTLEQRQRILSAIGDRDF